MSEYIHIFYIFVGFLMFLALSRISTHLCYIRYMLADISNKLERENKE